MARKTMKENQYNEKKSLRLFTTPNPDWKSLAKDCVCFANARGGIIAIGIEDKQDFPPPHQKISEDFPAKIQKRISELTINVALTISKQKESNNGEWIKIEILPSAHTIASTTNGQYYIRIADNCKPVLPDELNRLFTDKTAFVWETKVTHKVKPKDCDQLKLNKFIKDINDSDRVSDFIKQKSTEDLLLYYQLFNGEFLTNLGILWIGKREHRSQLLYAPVIQFIKYDENGNKVKKILLDDYSLNPKEMIESVWHNIPDWKEGIEISDGLFRKFIANYPEEVVRELLANALVHKPYTTRGDIFINLFQNRLEVHNSGLLPLGVTTNNILHQTVKRNEHLSKIFYDLKLMEREGSGYDKMYETLLTEGKKPPKVEERNDRVIVSTEKQIKDVQIVKLIYQIKQQFLLNQKETICLGIIAQHSSILSTEFSKMLQINEDSSIRNWIGKLIDYEIVLTKGKTKGREYFINPAITKDFIFGKTNLKKIEIPRLKHLILEDLSNHPFSQFSEIHFRIGSEIPIRKVRTALYQLVKESTLATKGGKKFRQYFLLTK